MNSHQLIIMDKNTNRVVYLDVIRVLSCILIVLMHSPHRDGGAPGYVIAPIYFITAAGLCLFFMVSGALLLPVKTDTFSFLRKRLRKILPPLLFWTLFYLCVSVAYGDKTWGEVCYSLVSIPFSRQGHGVLWFLYVLIGLYLLSPFISPMLQKATKKELHFYLLLWGISLCYPLLNSFVELTTDTYGILYYFSGFLGYYVLGFYLHTYQSRISKGVLSVLIIVPLALYAISNATGFNKQINGFFWYEGLMVAMMCVALYCGVRMLVDRFTYFFGGKFLTLLSNCAFGVYLMHIFIIDRLFGKSFYVVHTIGGFGQILITWIGTLIICFFATWVISYLPFSEYIIGFTSRKKK